MLIRLSHSAAAVRKKCTFSLPFSFPLNDLPPIQRRLESLSQCHKDAFICINGIWKGFVFHTQCLNQIWVGNSEIVVVSRHCLTGWLSAATCTGSGSRAQCCAMWSVCRLYIWKHTDYSHNASIIRRFKMHGIRKRIISWHCKQPAKPAAHSLLWSFISLQRAARRKKREERSAFKRRKITLAGPLFKKPEKHMVPEAEGRNISCRTTNMVTKMCLLHFVYFLLQLCSEHQRPFKLQFRNISSTFLPFCCQMATLGTSIIEREGTGPQWHCCTAEQNRKAAASAAAWMNESADRLRWWSVVWCIHMKVGRIEERGGGGGR